MWIDRYTQLQQLLDYQITQRPGQVVDTLSNNIIWYWTEAGDALELGK